MSDVSMELQLFPPEDTTIKCKTPEGETIEVDAMDLDELILQVYDEYPSDQTPKVTYPNIPRKEYLGLVREKFAQRYGYRMSLRSMDILLDTKTEILNKIKKNSYQQSDPVSSMESSQEQTES
jgi:hypothetical protein